MAYHKYVALLSVILFLGGCKDNEAETYELGKASGNIIDSVTGKPISGVSVLVEWNISGATGFSFGHGASEFPFYAGEAITDEKGYFEIVPPDRIDVPEGVVHRLSAGDPLVSAFHEDYNPTFFFREFYETHTIHYENAWLWFERVAKKPPVNFENFTMAPADPSVYLEKVRSKRESLIGLGCRVLDVPVYYNRIMKVVKDNMDVPHKYGGPYRLRSATCDGTLVEI